MLSFCPIDSSVYQLLHHTFLQFFTDPVRSVFYVLVRQSKCIQDIFLRLCYRVIKTIYIVGLSCHHEKLSPTCMRLADTILVSISGLVVLFLFGLVGTGSFSPFGILATSLLLTYSPQNGVILLVMAFLISPMGLTLAAIWLLSKVQSLKFAIQELVYG